MSDFDLDIKNYSINDLEKFFKLSKNYTEDDIEYKEYEIREQLLSSGNINRRLQKDIIDFLKKASEWLTYSKFGKKTKIAPTEIPKNWKLDTEDLPASKDIGKSYHENNLIKHPDKQFIYANNAEYYAGSLNPLTTRIISKYITIDTRNCSDSILNTSDFTIQLPEKLKKVVSIQLSSIEIPTNFFNISANFGNNFLYITVSQQLTNDGPITTYETIIVIPDGYYSELSLIQTINNLLCPKDEQGNIINTDSIFSYVLFTLDMGCNSTETNKVSVLPNLKYNTANTITNIELNFCKGIDGKSDNLNLNTKIGQVLGFTKYLYTGSTYHIGEVPININTVKYLYLSIDDYQRNVNQLFLNGYTKYNSDQNVLARISLNPGIYGSSLSENNFNLITEPRKYFGPVDIQKLHIQVFDNFGNILNMNNLDYSFVLLFKLAYDL